MDWYMQDSVCYGRNTVLLAIWNELVPPPPPPQKKKKKKKKKNAVLLDMDRFILFCITFTFASVCV